LNSTSNFFILICDFRWQDEEDEENIYNIYTKTTTNFRMTYQPWFQVWRILLKNWENFSQKKVLKKIGLILDIEMDNLGIDIRTL